MSADNGMLQLRINLSAADTDALFDLQAVVREAMVRYLVTKSPEAIPRTRNQTLIRGPLDATASSLDTFDRTP